MSDKPKFTPGPWEVEWVGNETHSILCARGIRDTDVIAEIIDEVGHIPRPERRANAILIAAAPEMLAALKLLVEEASINGAKVGFSSEVFDFATNAISKAEGRS